MKGVATIHALETNTMISPQIVRLAALAHASSPNGPHALEYKQRHADKFMETINKLASGALDVCPHCGATSDDAFCLICNACERRICKSCEQAHVVLNDPGEIYCSDCGRICVCTDYRTDGKGCQHCEATPGVEILHEGQVALERKESSERQAQADAIRESGEGR